MNRVCLCVGVSAMLAVCAAIGAAQCDQVLVLYNKDWTGDLIGTDKGQDSEEVARYYVERHTDPATGAKPYMLGLSCTHKLPKGDSHLIHDDLAEASDDNFFGVIYRGRGRPLTAAEFKAQYYYLLSPAVECHLDGRKLDWNSVTLKVASINNEDQAAAVYSSGASARKDDADLVSVKDSTEDGTKALLFNAFRAGYRGDVYVWLSAKDASGQVVIREKVRYFDPRDVMFTRTGPDGVRDDQNYLDDVEEPVKAFLNDPANAVNGQPLKDRILYIVVCYGLPQTVHRVYGLGQSGVPDSAHDSGNLVSLCDRLEMAFYDIEAARPSDLVPVRFRQRCKSFQIWTALPPYWVPFMGWRDQPYLHPTAYQGTQQATLLKNDQLPPHFTAELRNSVPQRFLFLCSRIDGADPHVAKYQIDAAEYASRYLTPRIGSRAEGTWDGAKALAETENKWSRDELKQLGFPGVRMTNELSVGFCRQADGTYLPGAVDWLVISGNGMNGPNSEVQQMLRNRVTVTGGAARALCGCPHTTSHAWWDPKVFYHYLFRGYDLGEAWMFSKFKCQWVTSRFGDPLYRPDLRNTRFDTTPPKVKAPQDMTVQVQPAAGSECRAVLQAKLETTRDNPELVLPAVEYWPEGDEKNVQRVAEKCYTRRPRMVLDHLKPSSPYRYRLILTDPYQNAFDSAKQFGGGAFRTGEPGLQNDTGR